MIDERLYFVIMNQNNFFKLDGLSFTGGQSVLLNSPSQAVNLN